MLELAVRVAALIICSMLTGSLAGYVLGFCHAAGTAEAHNHGTPDTGAFAIRILAIRDELISIPHTIGTMGITMLVFAIAVAISAGPAYLGSWLPVYSPLLTIAAYVVFLSAAVTAWTAGARAWHSASAKAQPAQGVEPDAPVRDATAARREGTVWRRADRAETKCFEKKYRLFGVRAAGQETESIRARARGAANT